MNYKLFKSIDEITMQRFIDFQCDMLVESGVGSTLQDFDKKLATIAHMISNEQPAKALTEIENMRLLFYNIQQKKSARFSAFSHLVKWSKKKDLSKVSVKTVYEETYKFQMKANADIEKITGTKLLSNEQLHIDTEVKKQVIAQLDEVITGDDMSGKINDSSKAIAKAIKVLKFQGGQAVNDLRNSFEKVCMRLQEFYPYDVKTMTVRSFYTALKIKSEQ